MRAFASVHVSEIGAVSGDLSFFFGRLRGDGIQLKEQEIYEKMVTDSNSIW